MRVNIDLDAPTTTTVQIEWIDSVSATATGNKIYRDDIEIADIGMGVQVYQDDTAETGTTYKYEVQAYSATDETTQEVTGVNTQTITTA